MARLSGHGLAYEGNAYTSPGVWSRELAGPGMGLCECGTYSPVIKNRARRKAWHRDHKADIAAGGTGIVWEGVR